MLLAFSTLLVFQCLGEGIAYALGWHVPGPVIGMLLLFIALLASPRLLARIEETASTLLTHLSLLFVPAGAGIVAAGASVQGQWLGLLAAVVGGTLLTLAVTALTMKAVWRGQDDDTNAGNRRHG